MTGLLKFLAASGILAFVFFAYRMGWLAMTTDDLDPATAPKLFGMDDDDTSGFGVYEMAYGAASALALFAGAKLMRMLPVAKKFAPAAQSPTGGK